MNTSSYAIMITLFLGFSPFAWYIKGLLFEWIIKKAKQDREFKNEIASITYMIISFAPPICSFSIVSAITTPEEKSAVALIVIFFIGLVINHLGRILRTELFERTKKEFRGYKKSDFEKVMKGEMR